MLDHEGIVYRWGAGSFAKFGNYLNSSNATGGGSASSGDFEWVSTTSNRYKFGSLMFDDQVATGKGKYLGAVSDISISVRAVVAVSDQGVTSWGNVGPAPSSNSMLAREYILNFDSSYKGLPLPFPVANSDTQLFPLFNFSPGKYGSLVDLSQISATGFGTSEFCVLVLNGNLAWSWGVSSAGQGQPIIAERFEATRIESLDETLQVNFTKELIQLLR
jgi:hypothetical protein